MVLRRIRTLQLFTEISSKTQTVIGTWLKKINGLTKRTRLVLASSDREYKNFKSIYERISGLELPLEYLQASQVYQFICQDKIIGGFILGHSFPLRTIDTFVSEKNKEYVSAYFTSENICEVCCFWIDIKFRKSLFHNAKFWLQMAYQAQNQSKPFLLFGTNSKGLAKMYGYPQNALMFYRDKINKRDTFLFLGRSSDIVGGIWEIILSKIFKQDRGKTSGNKMNLKRTLIDELSK